jgi:hypothetical protein
MGQEPISRRDRDLAELAAESGPDDMLSILAAIAPDAGYMLGLFANGMTIYGRIVGPREMAALLDAENERMAARWSAAGHEGWDEAAERIRGLWTKTIETEEAQSRKYAEHTSGDPFEVPEEVGRKLIRDRQRSLTLADAHVFPPASPRFSVPLLRVRLAMVAGWWLVPIDEQGNASFEHPTVNFGS